MVGYMYTSQDVERAISNLRDCYDRLNKKSRYIDKDLYTDITNVTHAIDDIIRRAAINEQDADYRSKIIKQVDKLKEDDLKAVFDIMQEKGLI